MDFATYRPLGKTAFIGAMILGVLQGCGGGKLTYQATLDFNDFLLRMPAQGLVVKAWTYADDNYTIAQEYTPDNSGKVVITSNSPNFSWGYGVAIKVQDQGNPFNYSLIATRFDDATPQINSEEFGKDAASIFFGTNLGDPTLSNFGDITVSGLANNTNQLQIRDTQKIYFDSQPSAMQIASQHFNLSGISFDLNPFSQPFIWATEYTLDAAQQRVPLHYGYSLASDSSRNISLSNSFASLPWEISPLNNGKLQADLFLYGITATNNSSAKFFMAQDTFKTQNQGQLQVPAQLPASGYQWILKYYNDINDCNLLSQVQSSLPRSIQVNDELFLITQANINYNTQLLNWQFNHPMPNAERINLTLNGVNAATSSLFYWHSSLANTAQQFRTPQIPKAIGSNSTLVGAKIVLEDAQSHSTCEAYFKEPGVEAF